MSDTRYKDRETVGKRLNLTMLAYQEPAMYPKNGYVKPKEVSGVLAYSKAYVPPTDHRTVSKQKSQDKINYQKRVAEATKKNQLTIVFGKNKPFTSRDVMAWLGMSERHTSSLICSWVKDGLIVQIGTENRLKLYSKK